MAQLMSEIVTSSCHGKYDELIPLYTPLYTRLNIGGTMANMRKGDRKTRPERERFATWKACTDDAKSNPSKDWEG